MREFTAAERVKKMSPLIDAFQSQLVRYRAAADSAAISMRTFAFTGANISTPAGTNYLGTEESDGFTVPDVAGKIVAYRAWKIVDLESLVLRSGSYDNQWLPRPAGQWHLEAFHLGYDHPAPHERCSCGIHACVEQSQALKDYISLINRGSVCVVGKVELWGKVVRHSLGYRAQFARIHSFLAADKNELLIRLARRYDVPIEKDARFAAPEPYAEQDIRISYHGGGFIPHKNGHYEIRARRVDYGGNWSDWRSVPQHKDHVHLAGSGSIPSGSMGSVSLPSPVALKSGDEFEMTYNVKLDDGC